jgi:hypothetical protein
MANGHALFYRKSVLRRSGCRYLVARGYNVCKAAQALRRTLQWRALFRPDAIEWDDVKNCATGGRLELVTQTDKSNRPIILYRLRSVARRACGTVKQSTALMYI